MGEGEQELRAKTKNLRKKFIYIAVQFQSSKWTCLSNVMKIYGLLQKEFFLKNWGNFQKNPTFMNFKIK